MNNLEEKKQQMESCEHLFVKLRNGYEYSGFHSSDSGNDPHMVECLLCGLTNKFEEYDMELLRSFPEFKAFVDVNRMVFKKQFSRFYSRSGKSFDNSAFNLISEEVFKCNHSILLYKIAKDLKPDADNDELFETMKELYALETPLEQRGTEIDELLEELPKRYRKDRMVKTMNFPTISK